MREHKTRSIARVGYMIASFEAGNFGGRMLLRRRQEGYGTTRDQRGRREASGMALVLFVFLVLMIATPGMAAAETRSGVADDPAGDSLGTPSQDIVRATALYSDGGTLNVSATVNGDIASSASSLVFFVSSSASPSCSPLGVNLGASSNPTARDGVYTVSGYSGGGTASKSVSGATLTLGIFGESAIANQNYQCMIVALIDKASNTQVDSLNTPLFFRGYGPDADGDRVADNVDQCPSVPGIAPSGCPPAPAPAPAPAPPPTETAPAPVAPSSPTPQAYPRRKYISQAVLCAPLTKKHVAGQRRTPYNICAGAMGRIVFPGYEKTPARACAPSMHRKRAGQKRSDFSLCVIAGKRLVAAGKLGYFLKQDAFTA